MNDIRPLSGALNTMAVTSSRRSPLIAFLLTLGLVMLAAQPSRAVEAAQNQAELATHGLTVTMDQARIVRLPPRVTTLVIGNPLIADATVQNGGLMVLTGKGIGSTNLIALDARGEQLMAVQIRVRPQNDAVVQVYRGVERETYSCTPTCERTMAVGDSKVFFDTALGQSRSRDAAASNRGAAAAAPR
ncbi:pilus assembly protein N-terminal domain-containing protein [Phreatobacter stygius]|uniref:Pilus assembly protein CpaC n=1 Tax=Phreatobacter stygius TaxID=1940610 RepID=A0A4D7AXS3_9HYPH|nr:pilus assembly protein N-terminal domain-containing protein [Phreatobacter stygius]QCI64951.1 pilus assembly protein CpaC [Phreatobacter stygius]